MLLQQVFLYASSNPTEVLITHWVSQCRGEEFSWGSRPLAQQFMPLLSPPRAARVGSHLLHEARGWNVHPQCISSFTEVESVLQTSVNLEIQEIISDSFFQVALLPFSFLFSFCLLCCAFSDCHSFAPLNYGSLTGWTEYDRENLEDVLTLQYCSRDDCQMLVLSWGDVWEFFNHQMGGWRMLDNPFLCKLLFAINTYLWHNFSVTLLKFCSWFHSFKNYKCFFFPWCSFPAHLLHSWFVGLCFLNLSALMVSNLTKISSNFNLWSYCCTVLKYP